MSPSQMTHRSSITDEDRKFIETWENVSLNQTVILKLDPRGEETQQMISGPRKFYVTTEERLITQDRIVRKKDDPFQNGSFRPILVPADVTVETNPNALSEGEIVTILRLTNEMAWDGWMEAIDSPDTLQRMLDTCEDAGVSLKRFRQVEARLEAVKPKKRVVQKDRTAYEGIGATRA